MFQKQHIPILLSIECSPYCDLFTQSSAHLPVLYHSLFDSEHLKLNYFDLVETGEKMTGLLLDVTEQHYRHLEELTRGQAFSKLGFTTIMRESQHHAFMKLYAQIHTNQQYHYSNITFLLRK